MWLPNIIINLLRAGAETEGRGSPEGANEVSMRVYPAFFRQRVWKRAVGERNKPAQEWGGWIGLEKIVLFL